jgi:RNA polymerase sigma-70 factor (ECF subfamily)
MSGWRTRGKNRPRAVSRYRTAPRQARDETARRLVNLFMMGVVTVERGTPEVLEQVGSRRSADQADEADSSFEALYRQRYRDVFRYALLMLRSAEEAEDVTADAFQRAFGAWRSGHGPAGQALPWLLLITRRLVIDRSRRRRLLSWLPLASLHPSQEPAVDSDAERSEFWMWFDRLARELPERQREVLILRYQRDLSDDQIGEILGISSSAVRSLVARACAALRRNPEIWQ